MKTTIIVILAIVAFSFISLRGIENTERAECIKWQEQAKEIQDYWITKWQADQCEKYNIKVGKNN